jgi:hypothetical protein
MAWRRALALLLALSACTSGSAPQALRSSPPTRPTPSVVLPPTKPTAEPSPSPEPSYGRLPSSSPLSGFEPTSVSFVSTRTGWFLGTATCGQQRCAALLQTRDAGRTFVRRTAPPVHVAQVRFADLDQGWAFGNKNSSTMGDPGLWRTHDGGRTWRRVLDTPVPSLEVGGGQVWAVELDGGGTAPRLFRGSLTGDGLRFAAGIPNRSATVTVGHGTAYVVAEQGAGPIPTRLVVVSRSSTRAYPNPCASKYTWNLQVAVGASKHLVAICSGEPAAGSQMKKSFASVDDGRTWTARPDPPWDGYIGPSLTGGVAATSTRTFMTGSRNGINVEIGSDRWRRVLLDDDGTGFSFIGFTDDTHGVALGEHGAWMTDSAGEHWRRLRFA